MEFKDPQVLWLILAVLPLFLLLRSKENSFERYFDKDILKKMYQKNKAISKRVRGALFLSSIIFAIIALARPYIDNGQIKVKSSDIDLVVGFDVSNSMFCDDLYPNRFEFSKRKFGLFLDNLKRSQVGVIGFSSRSFLISPLTRDFATLKYLVKNMKLDFVSLKGTNILSALDSTANLLKNSKQKALLLFTDGGDKSDYQKEIAYAKKHGIKLFVYGVATKKGGVIKTKDGVIKDKDGNIVITKLNEAIKELALKSGGGFMPYSLSDSDMKVLANSIESAFKEVQKKERSIKDTKEIFYYPLLISILLFLLSFISLPTRRAL